jgi:Flp pilus assembly protein TadG
MLLMMRATLADLSRRFRNGESGVAAVEFALLLPIMCMIWVGMVVVTDALNADRKVTVLTRTLSDLATQFTVISQSDLDSIFNATSQVLWPKAAENLGMRLTSIDVDGAGVAWVDWSGVPTNSALRGSYSATARCNKINDLPAGLKTPRTSVILAETSMKYSASLATDLVNEIFGGVFSNGQMPLGDKLYMRPRQVTKVTFSPPPAGNCAGYVP